MKADIQKMSKTKSRAEIAEEQECIALSGPVIRQKPLDKIVLDPGVYPRSRWKQYLVKRHLQLLLDGHALPPVKVEEETMRLLDGYATWRALKIRRNLYNKGRLPNVVLSPVELHTVRVEWGHPSDDQENNLGNRIRTAYLERRGIPLTRLAKVLNCDFKTAKKYAGGLVKEWDEEKTELQTSLATQGMPLRHIARELRTRYPFARGFSAPSISRSIQRNQSGSTESHE